MEVNNATDAIRADSYIQLRKAIETGSDVRVQLASTLDVVRSDWRQDEALVAKLKSVGFQAAAESMLHKVGI